MESESVSGGGGGNRTRVRHAFDPTSSNMYTLYLLEYSM